MAPADTLTLASLLAEIDRLGPTAPVEELGVNDEPFSERERLLRIETRQAAFEEIVKEQRTADRSQLVAIITRADGFAGRPELEKLEIRVEAADRAATELREKLVPRREIESKLEAVNVTIDGIKTDVRGLASVISTLDTTLKTQASDRATATSKSDSKRNAVIAAIAAGAAVIGVYFAAHAPDRTTYVPVFQTPGITTTTIGGGHP